MHILVNIRTYQEQACLVGNHAEKARLRWFERHVVQWTARDLRQASSWCALLSRWRQHMLRPYAVDSRSILRSDTLALGVRRVQPSEVQFWCSETDSLSQQIRRVYQEWACLGYCGRAWLACFGQLAVLSTISILDKFLFLSLWRSVYSGVDCLRLILSGIQRCCFLRRRLDPSVCECHLLSMLV